jgi:signal transduction histidine kinase
MARLTVAEGGWAVRHRRGQREVVMPVIQRIGSSHSAALLLGLAVLAGACLIAAWLRTRRDEQTKGQRGRLRELGWCAALIVLTVMVLSTLHPLLVRNNLSWLIVVAIAATIIVIFWPDLPARVVPVALILYGLSGFIVARDYASAGLGSYGVTPLWSAGTPGSGFAELILPQAYALLLLGGWLALRSTDSVLTRARRRLGSVARAPLGDQLRTLALLLVVAVLAGLLAPRLWLAGGAALILTPVLVWGVLYVIKRWPVRAAQLTTVGLLCLGIAGLAIVAFWQSNSQPASKLRWVNISSVQPSPSRTLPPRPSRKLPPRPSRKLPPPPPRSLAQSFVTISPASASASPKTPALKTVGPVACAAWLKSAAGPITCASAGPITCAARFSSAAPFQSAAPVKGFQGFTCVRPLRAASPATAANFSPAQPLPYGAVLVDSQATADAAGVEGLAFLALGAWLAPQTFPWIRRRLGGAPDPELTRRVERLTASRAVAVDTASADLRRLERDLHDGAQARLVALGMSLRAAERLIPTSPDAAIALVAEARETSVKALTELRELVRGVLPPVLADRGLADAVRALALDSPLHVETDIDLPGRLSAPVETACYFAVAELLTNAAKHSSARDARISVSHSDRLLRIEVTDFGLGGADPAKGSGLAGVERRLATFDGIMAVSSPAGGPTIVIMEVPCAMSSPRTSSC